MYTAEDFADFEGRHVSVTFREDGVKRQVEGLVTRANQLMGILIRPKSRRLVMVETDDIITMTVMEDPNQPRVKVRYLDIPDENTIRQHLADRHGLKLSEIPDSPRAALSMHDGIDHAELGHKHDEKPVTAAISAKGAAARAAAIDGDTDTGAEEGEGDDEAEGSED